MRSSVECDVLVVGTGVAGVGAAVGAARTGARTLLVGDEAAPGGVAVAGMHRAMCGLFRSGRPAPTRPLNEGLVEEVFESLKQRNPATTVAAMGRVYVLPFKTEHLVLTLLEQMAAEPSLEVRFRTRVTDVAMDGGNVRRVRIEDERGACAVGVRAVVDCSGDGAVVRIAGARCQSTPARDLQLAGQSVRLECVADSCDMLHVKVPYHLAQGVADGDLPLHAKFAQYVPGDAVGEAYLKLSVPPTMADREARADEDAHRVHRYLQQVLPEFRSSRLAARSPRVVEREGKRIFGEYTLTEEDVLSARKFADGIVKSAWPIEVWDQERGLRFKYLPEGEHYEIPLRCVKVADIANAWAAGRCISATHMAHASTRAMGTCISLGEKAGQQAALSLQTS
jgi:2-polyprenyl-6-methoxyphenol hydroxylase-like FAD-dependent oxidoreductase